VLVLKAFQHEEWPLKATSPNNVAMSQANAVRAAEQAVLRHSSHGNGGGKSTAKVDATTTSVALEEDQHTVDTQTEEANIATADPATESTDGDVKPASQSTLADAETNKEDAPIAVDMKDNLPEDRIQNAISAPLEDDPQTREPIHPSILATLEAFMLVLQDPAKQPKPSELALEGITMIVANRYLSGRAGGQHEGSSSPTVLTRLLESAAKSSESNNDAVQTALVVALTTIMTCPKCSIHENSMLTALRSTFHVYLVTKSTACKASAKRALLNMLRSVLFRMEAHDAVNRSVVSSFKSTASTAALSTTTEDSDVATSNGTASPTFASQYHADAYYLIRSLCKLSSKELPADMADEAALKAKHAGLLLFSLVPTDPTELNSKVLALELILAAMESCGEAFINSSKFVYLIQHYLCGSLLKNCVSNHTQVAFLSQKIFLVLVRSLSLHMYLLRSFASNSNLTLCFS
jgi:Guanine nucleotide exchange factor in Golgi transport N-terminal